MLPLRFLIPLAPLVCSLGFHSATAAESPEQPAPAAAVQLAGESPADVATRFATDLAVAQSTAKQMVKSGLVLVSDFCPAEKQVNYRTRINEMRAQLKGAKVDSSLTRSKTIGNFAYAVLTLVPENSSDDVIITGIALVRTAADQPWKIAIGVRHFNNTGTLLSPESLADSRRILTEMLATEHEARANFDAHQRDAILSRVSAARKALELDKLTAQELVNACLYPDKELTDYQRLAFFALDPEASTIELRTSLESARRINMLCGPNARPVSKQLYSNVDNEDAEPLRAAPWMPDLLNERPHQSFGTTYFLAPRSVRRAMGCKLDPLIQTLKENTIVEEGAMACIVGMFDPENPGRFTSTPVYLVKQDGGWRLQLLDSSMIHRIPHGGSAFTQPSQGLTRWAIEETGEALDSFAAMVWQQARDAHPHDPAMTNTEVATGYLNAAIDRDVLRALSFFSQYVADYGTSMTRATKAMKQSFESLDPANYEVLATPETQTDVIDERAAITWLATIETKNPENLTMAPVITELVDGRWGVLPDIHSVAPLNEENFRGIRNRVPLIDAEHSQALAKIDKHRTSERDAKIQQSFKLLMDAPLVIGATDQDAALPPATEFSSVQNLVSETARRLANAPLLDVLKSGAVFETKSEKVRQRFLTDIGNDRQLFKSIDGRLELVRVLKNGRWLGAIVRDAAILDRGKEPESPSTKDTLSLRLFVAVDGQWMPILGASFIKEENVGMKWINKQALKAARQAIGAAEAAVLDGFIKELNNTPANAPVEKSID